MIPFHFGDRSAPLFGCFHPAAGNASGGGGAVLCPPVLHEYMAAHRTMRQLALRLSQGGIAALRFDLFGTGDSAGDAGEGRPSRWRRDLEAAAGELERRAGTPPALIGMRLGAAFALARQVAPDAPEVPALVLWDPVLDGASYVRELTALQGERFRATADEVLGFPFGPDLRAALAAIDLRSPEMPRARRVLVVETGAVGTAGARGLAERLRQSGADVEYRLVDAAPIWHEPGKTAVSAQAVQAVVSWMKGRHR